MSAKSSERFSGSRRTLILVVAAVVVLALVVVIVMMLKGKGEATTTSSKAESTAGEAKTIPPETASSKGFVRGEDQETRDSGTGLGGFVPPGSPSSGKAAAIGLGTAGAASETKRANVQAKKSAAKKRPAAKHPAKRRR